MLKFVDSTILEKLQTEFSAKNMEKSDNSV